MEEIERYKEGFEKSTGKPFPISFGKYTGQEDDEERKRLQENPPDILLTNYMMLELILTRIREKGLPDTIYAGLRYLVFDELHMYRGRQGADVAMLIRRIKAQCANPVTCIGTSATMVSGVSRQSKGKWWLRLRANSSANNSLRARLSVKLWRGRSTGTGLCLGRTSSSRRFRMGLTLRRSLMS